MPGDKVAFDGLRLRLKTTDLADDAFQTIAAGEAVEVEFDPAVVHDLSAGGEYDIVAKGVLHTADASSNAISGAIPFSSNVLKTTVDAAAAAKARRDFHEHAKRQVIQSDCTGSKRTSSVNALSNCASLANSARTAALSGSASLLNAYFKSSSTSTRNAVAAVYSSVSGECDSSTSGVSREYCTDVYGACSSNVLAYTLPSQSYIVNCNLYFSALPALTKTCHAQDQATTTLHETTHLRQIKGTQDLAYGDSAAKQLSASQALNNADTFGMFLPSSRLTLGKLEILTSSKLYTPTLSTSVEAAIRELQQAITSNLANEIKVGDQEATVVGRGSLPSAFSRRMLGRCS